MEVIRIAKRVCNFKDLSEYGKKIYEPLYQIYSSKEKSEYEKNSKTLWETLNFGNKFNYIKIKALVIKVIRDGVFVVIPQKNSDSNRNNAIYQDISYIMFDLLDRSFYNKKCFEVTNIASYEMRYNLYIEANSYTRVYFKKNNSSAEYKRTERILATIANFLSKQENVANYLRKAICEYIEADSNGMCKLILQKPCLTPENFPSLVQRDQLKPETISKMPIRIDCIFEDGDPIPYYRDSSEEDEKQTDALIQEELQFSNKAIKDTEQPEDKGLSSEALDPGKITGKLSLISIISEIKIKDIFNMVHMVKNTIFLSKKYFKPIFLASLLSICTSLSGDQPVALNEVDPNFTVSTKVRTSWSNGTSLKVGDIVEFQINYKNTSDQTQNDVLVDSDLPANLKYIAGTTRLYNGKYTSGASVDSNAITLNGINIGNYTAGANALVRFKAEVVDETFTCGLFTLRNWGRVSIGSKVIQDSADVNVCI